MAARILIVDDEPNIVLSLEFLLRKEGYEVATAPNGGEALHQTATFRPHLIVLDVMLPAIDGFPPLPVVPRVLTFMRFGTMGSRDSRLSGDGRS